MNPLATIPAAYRKYVYAVLGLAAIIVGAIQVSDGDVLEAIAYVLGALGFGTALSNLDDE